MIYIVQGRYTQAAMKGMLASPEDRSEQARGLFKRAGVRMAAYYATFGHYNFMIVCEGEADPKDVMGAMMIAGSAGGVEDVLVTLGMPVSDLKAAAERASANSARYKAPGHA